MGVWGDHVLPRLTDRALSRSDVGELRAAVCAPLRGRVLEIGFGSGLNVPWYPAEVTSLSAVEPSDVAWRLSLQRRGTSPIPIQRSGLDGQRLDEADGTHDAVLSTFTLCTLPDPAGALAEMLRVVRADGVLCLLEHGLAPDPRVAAWQRRLDGLQSRIFGGCHLTRDVERLARESGAELTRLETSYLEGPATSRPWSYGYLVVANPVANSRI